MHGKGKGLDMSGLRQAHGGLGAYGTELIEDSESVTQCLASRKRSQIWHMATVS